MRHVWLVLALAACKQGAGDDYPINPGGDDTGSFHPPVDAPGADQALDDGNTMINGRVCLLADLRAPTTCASTGAGNIGVTLGSSQTVTADDGSFSIVSSGAGVVWQIGGTGVVNSLVPVTTSVLLPAITTTYYEDLQTTNGVILNAGQGSIVLYVRDSAGPLAGASVTVMPAPTYLPMHDTANKSVWVTGNTGVAGVSWTAGATAGALPVTVTAPGGATQQRTLPVADGAITYATVTF